MIVHILTAVTRPENLPEVKESIEAAHDLALAGDHDIEVQWHKYEDLEREFVGGQRPKNQMLSHIEDGWVCILDDDTTMHPKFLKKVYHAARISPYTKAIVVSQKRTTGVVLQACPDNMRVGKVDAGQAVLKRSFVGDLLIPETYAGDGEWLECLLRDEPNVHYMSEVLSLHNALSGVDVSETPERMGA